MQVVLHIPHASLRLPLELLPCPEALPRLEEELLPMTDRYTDSLFDHGLCPCVKADVSRLICDVERFPSDEEEPMARKGMGVVYTHGHDGLPLYAGQLPKGYRNHILENCYWPHHRKLEKETYGILSDEGKVLILDCHSFSSRPLAYEDDKAPGRPEVCLGTDSFHTPPCLVEHVGSFLSSRGISFAIDRPYGGSLVPMAHYRKDKRVWALMVEVNRSLYMDEETGERTENFGSVASLLEELELTLLALK